MWSRVVTGGVDKMKNLNFTIISILLCFLIAGCSSYSSHRRCPDIPIRVEGVRIFLEDQEYAELRFFRSGSCIRAFTIHYFQTDEDEWVYPEEGWVLEELSSGMKYDDIEEIDRLWNSGREGLRLLLGDRLITKEKFVSTFTCLSDINISEKGDRVTFKKKGMLFKTSHSYEIQ